MGKCLLRPEKSEKTKCRWCLTTFLHGPESPRLERHNHRLEARGLTDSILHARAALPAAAACARRGCEDPGAARWRTLHSLHLRRLHEGHCSSGEECSYFNQRAFRGWRTRCRVVLQVREDMELLVSDIRRQLDDEWALLGPTAMATAFSLNWGGETRLRLPRMEDALFGVSVHFPQELEEREDGATAIADAATDGPLSPDKAPTGSAFEKPASADAERVVGTQVSQGTDAEEKTAVPTHRISETSRRDARVSAVEICGLQAETSEADSTERQVENMDGQPGKDGDFQLASVLEILATHSRADILLELQWARQALRDRRKYLRSKQRVERGPDPCACA